MTKIELMDRLIKENIPTTSYWIDSGKPCYGEVYCLEKNENMWEIYYSERGNKNCLKTFSTEEQACDYFYTWLTGSLRRMGLI